MAMLVAAENVMCDDQAAAIARPETNRRPVARCLFGTPNPGDLERMEQAVAEAETERFRLAYGMDLAEFNKLFDVLIVQVPEQGSSQPSSDITPEEQGSSDDISEPPEEMEMPLQNQENASS